MALTKAEARLEALKLAVRPSLDKATILDTATSYYDFIVKDEDQLEPQSKGKTAKEAGGLKS